MNELKVKVLSDFNDTSEGIYTYDKVTNTLRVKNKDEINNNPNELVPLGYVNGYRNLKVGDVCIYNGVSGEFTLLVVHNFRYQDGMISFRAYTASRYEDGYHRNTNEDILEAHFQPWHVNRKNENKFNFKYLEPFIFEQDYYQSLLFKDIDRLLLLPGADTLLSEIDNRIDVDCYSKFLTRCGLSVNITYCDIDEHLAIGHVVGYPYLFEWDIRDGSVVNIHEINYKPYNVSTEGKLINYKPSYDSITNKFNIEYFRLITDEVNLIYDFNLMFDVPSKDMMSIIKAYNHIELDLELDR